MNTTNTSAQTHMKNYTVTCENGSTVEFTGRMYSETSYHEEETNTLTRLRLFVTNDQCQVYSIVSTTGVRKQHRFYKIKPLGTLCEMSDGKQTLVVPTEMLFAAVFGLCGIDPATADQMRPSFEETLNAAVAG